MGFSLTSPLSPRSYCLDDLPVRLHEVYHISLTVIQAFTTSTADDIFMLKMPSTPIYGIFSKIKKAADCER